MFRDCDSPKYYATAQIGGLYPVGGGNVVVSSTGGRNGNGRCWSVSTGSGTGQGLARVLDLQATWGDGFALNIASLPGAAVKIWSFQSNGHELCYCNLEPNGTISAWRFAAVGSDVKLGQTTAAVTVGTYHAFGFMVKLHATTGTLDVWLDNANVLHLTGQNTLGYDGTYTTGDTCVAFFCSPITAHYMDDRFWWDGTSPNGALDVVTYPGDKKVYAQVPNGAGNASGWTKSGTAPAATNWQSVADATPDDGTTLIQAALGDLNAIDQTTVAAMSGTPASVIGVVVAFRGQKDDVNTRKVTPVLRPGGTNRLGTEATLSTGWVYYKNAWAINPDTSAAWTYAAVNACQIGVRLTLATDP